jgi:hypothetical protein
VVKKLWDVLIVASMNALKANINNNIKALQMSIMIEKIITFLIALDI